MNAPQTAPHSDAHDADTPQTVLLAQNLTKHYTVKRGLGGTGIVKALNGVSVEISPCSRPPIGWARMRPTLCWPTFRLTSTSRQSALTCRSTSPQIGSQSS